MEYDIDDTESVCEAVVFSVSSAKGCDPRTLKPLHDVVDPDALNELSSPKYDGEARMGANVSFIYSDYRVSVDSGEYITIQPTDA